MKKPPLLLSLFCVLALAFCLSACQPQTINSDDAYEQTGAFPVSQNRLSINNSEDDSAPLKATLYRPIHAGDDKHALVIVLPGFGASYTAYRAYSTHLASHGYWVLGMNFVANADPLDAEHEYRARQVSHVIDYLLNDSTLAGSVEPTQIALLGHSMGAKIAFFTASFDPRVKAVIALDPVNAGGPPCFLFPDSCAAYPVAPNPERGHTGVLAGVKAASLILRSAPDAAFNPEAEFNANRFYYGSDGNGLNGVPAPALYFDMGAVGHADYLTVINNPTVQVSKRTALAWLEHTFHNVDAETYFTGDRVQADIAAGRIQSVGSRGL